MNAVFIAKAAAIEGWMAPVELIWLAEQAQKHQCIVEIGSHLGRSTRALGDNTPGVVYAVDNWAGPPEVSMPFWEREKLYDRFLENMNGLIESKKVIPVKANHQTVNLDVKPDMVFIDGCHEYEAVRDDIAKWQHVDFLCGHDATWEGVRKALDETPWKIELIEGTEIWVRCEK